MPFNIHEPWSVERDADFLIRIRALDPKDREKYIRKRRRDLGI